MSPVEYTNYKIFIKSQLKHGKQLEFSNYLQCQSAFISQVLKGKPNLSMEQGLLATEYFKLNKVESEYFMLALQLSRSGSVKLENYFKTKMLKLREDYLRVDNKIGTYEKINELTKTIFYSSWKYALIHVLLSIPTKNQYQLLLDKSNLNKNEIDDVLDFLKTSGLIVYQNERWQLTKNRIHISPEDPLINLHHKNFRTLTSNHLESRRNNNFHFSSAMALSASDCEKIKSILLDSIKKTEDILKPSPEETLRILNIDFFETGNQ